MGRLGRRCWKICQLQIKHINDVLKDPTKTKSREAFESFKKELKATLNDSLTDDEIVEMLGQHVVTQPILDALFTIQTSEGTSYEFSKQNPIAIAMTSMMDSLDKESMRLATKSLEDFIDLSGIAQGQLKLRQIVSY